MPIMNIENLDLNLLLVFESLLAERNVTRAARRLGRTQSAVSAALRRLRQAFGDPLFVRTGRGVVPTERALAVGESVVRALGDLRGAFEAETPFDPSSSTRRFTIELHEETAIALLPPLLAALRRSAPRVVLHALPLDGHEPSQGLATGAVELAVGPFKKVGSGYDQLVVARPPYVVVARRGHPFVRSGRRPSLAAYTSCAHVLVSPRGRTMGVVDRALAELGKSRMTFVTSSWSAAMLAVQSTDLLLTTPVWAARAFTSHVPRVIAPVPLDLPLIEVALLWHRRTAGDRGLAWLRKMIIEAAAAAARPSRARFGLTNLVRSG
jgi:DNA-binding transcriptional LysR family regulator